MAEDDVLERLPKFLESFENLTSHFDEHFDERGSNERGDTFLDLAMKVISLTNEGQDFPALRPARRRATTVASTCIQQRPRMVGFCVLNRNTRLEARTNSTVF